MSVWETTAIEFKTHWVHILTQCLCIFFCLSVSRIEPTYMVKDNRSLHVSQFSMTMDPVKPHCNEIAQWRPLRFKPLRHVKKFESCACCRILGYIYIHYTPANQTKKKKTSYHAVKNSAECLRNLWVMVAAECSTTNECVCAHSR